MSTEEQIRQQLEAARRDAKARADFAKLMRDGQWGRAAAIATSLGAQLASHQVVRADFRRAKPSRE
jgi:hypothetical protein